MSPFSDGTSKNAERFYLQDETVVTLNVLCILGLCELRHAHCEVLCVGLGGVRDPAGFESLLNNARVAPTAELSGDW